MSRKQKHVFPFFSESNGRFGFVINGVKTYYGCVYMFIPVQTLENGNKIMQAIHRVYREIFNLP